MMFRPPTPPIEGCAICGATEPNWYGHDGWLCESAWIDLQEEHQTVYGSHKNHALLMLDSMAPSALTDPERAKWLWSARDWLRDNVDADDVRFILLGHEKIFEEPSEQVADCVTSALADIRTGTPFQTLLDRLADAVRRAMGPEGTGY